MVNFPVEIIEEVILTLWNSRLISTERIALMTACPLLNHAWKAQFARIASKSIHIPGFTYLLYLANIVRTGSSLIYDKWDLQHRAQTITCFLDAVTSGPEPPSYRSWDQRTWEMYRIFTYMGNFIGLRMCFPAVKRLNLESLFYSRFHSIGTCALLEARVTIIFVNEGNKESSRIPTNLSTYSVHFDVNLTVIDGREAAIAFLEKRELGRYPRYLIAAVAGGLRRHYNNSQRIRQMRDRDASFEGLFKRCRRDSKYSLSYVATFDECWMPEDIFDAHYHLWRAGRTRRNLFSKFSLVSIH